MRFRLHYVVWTLVGLLVIAKYIGLLHIAHGRWVVG
jgi:hypothetical protein